ncbi:MAG: polysaccharide biosynthesis protein PslH [Actinomycetota bacterium]
MAGRDDIVLVTPVVPGDSGYGLRMRAGLLRAALGRLGPLRVIVVPVHGREPDDEGVTVVELDRHADPSADFAARLASARWRDRAAALHPRPALCRAATVAATESVARQIGDASLVVMQRLYLAPFLDLVLDAQARPGCVIDVDDVESATHRQLDEAVEAERYDRLERHYLPSFDRVIACAQADADDMRARCGADAIVVPNAVTPAAIATGPKRWDLVFVGNLSYGPNVDAVTWLCREVMPLLPDARVVLVGRDPDAAVTALAEPGRVDVTGTVDDVTPYYAASKVAVVPLRTGGGTSVKLIEAMAAGLPVVTTTVGARGIDVRAGEHVLVADAAVGFAAAAGRLLDDDEAAQRMGGAGRALVEQRYVLERVAADLAEHLTPFVAGARRVR